MTIVLAQMTGWANAGASGSAELDLPGKRAQRS